MLNYVLLNLSLLFFYVDEANARHEATVGEDQVIIISSEDSQQLVDTLQEISVLITTSDCFVKSIAIPETFRTHLGDWTSEQLRIEAARVATYNDTEYASDIHDEQVSNILRPSTRLLCRGKHVWSLQDHRDPFVGNVRYQKTRRKRSPRSPKTSKVSRSTVNHMRHSGNANGNAIIAEQRPGRIEQENFQSKPRFQHYSDFNSESVLGYTDDLWNSENLNHGFQQEKYPIAVKGVEEHKTVSSYLNHLTSEGHPEQEDYYDEFSEGQMEEQLTASDLPNTIVKNGQIFYRHDGTQEEIKTSPQSSVDSSHSSDYSDHTAVDRAPRLKNSFHETKTFPSFDYITKSSSHEPSSRMASAAAAAMVESSPDGGTTSRLIGTATNGGYFAARTHSVDGNGAAHQSFIKGNGKMSSGSVLHVKPGSQIDVKADAEDKNGVQSFVQANRDTYHSLVTAQVMPSDGYDAQENEHKDEKISYQSQSAGMTDRDYNELQIMNNNDKKIPTYDNMNKVQSYTHGIDSYSSVSAKTSLSPSDQIIDKDGLSGGAGVPTREHEFEQVVKGSFQEGSNKYSQVGLVTVPFSNVGLPPAPSEILSMSELLTPNSAHNSYESSGLNKRNFGNMMIKSSNENLKPPMIEEDLSTMPDPKILYTKANASGALEETELTNDTAKAYEFAKQEGVFQETGFSSGDSSDTVVDTSLHITKPSPKVTLPSNFVGTNGRDKEEEKETGASYRHGTPLEAGREIPGLPGYYVPNGFRGKILYGLDDNPLEVSSKKVVQGYNTHVILHRSSAPSDQSIYASVSGPEASASFPFRGNKSGIHITLSGEGSGLSSSSNVVSSVGPNHKMHTGVITSDIIFPSSTQRTSSSSTSSVRRCSSSRYQDRCCASRRRPCSTTSSRSSSRRSDCSRRCGSTQRYDCRTTSTPSRRARICKPVTFILYCC